MRWRRSGIACFPIPFRAGPVHDAIVSLSHWHWLDVNKLADRRRVVEAGLRTAKELPWSQRTPHPTRPVTTRVRMVLRRPLERRLMQRWDLAVLDAEPCGCLAGPGDRHPHLAVMAGAARGPDGRCGGGSARAVQGLPGRGPDAELDRPDVERQPAARGDPGRLGRDRARPAHRLAALAAPTRRRALHGDRSS